ncbi:RagB/SusD family nutrient uptake outer membrane protein [Flavihumibacter petaseus]|uniref:RagB/SusD family nutrient uptake outer membrane protein n=1 Tax=Flavihumibacter petaseus NBRC 106054 TaxID=1220578 RepID=A0A0E9N159_9BACT|nr:RagB/SusD family nutrient uptake outer membrane protein [Flavihumibacter petaseus]GAO43371.1 hypothetical protein FPE01S_02_04760 [Flavihumibacter petaseus NBRC 106054]
MKYIYLLACVSVLTLAGCKKDFLDRSPLDAYSNSSLWTSRQDVTAALNGCYSGWELGDNIVYNDCMTDNGYDQFPWEGYETLASGYATPTDYGIGRWDYTTVQRCNWFLDNVDKTPSTALSDELKASMKGEVRFLRAYQYFIMSQVYGDVPLVLHELSPAEANTVSRTPKAAVVQFILDELNAIAPDLPVSYEGTEIGRITRGAALGLKARTELFNEKWADCIATTRQLMTAPFTYSLYPSYSELFRPGNANNEEVMLDVQYLKDDNAAWVLIVLAPNSQGGWSSVSPTQQLLDAYETINGKTISTDAAYNPSQPYNNRDPRLDATIIRPGAMYEGAYFDPYSGTDYYKNNNCSPTGYNVRKFIPQLEDFRGTEYGTDIDNTGLNFIVMRYAEMLLTYAEAKIEAGQIDASVYNAIDAVRQRAGMPVTDQSIYNDQASLRTLVRRERRVELAMEGLRWFDIQRWKIGETVMPGTVTGALLGSVNPDNGNLTLTNERISPVSERVFDTKNYLFPIPQKEIDLNKNLSQNPGY